MEKDKLCDYCGKNLAQVSIVNPNDAPDVIKNTYWDVCKICKNIISAQQVLSMAAVIKNFADKSNDDVQRKLGNKIYDEANNKVKEILKNTGDE